VDDDLLHKRMEHPGREFVKLRIPPRRFKEPVGAEAVAVELLKLRPHFGGLLLRSGLLRFVALRQLGALGDVAVPRGGPRLP
jgi:hypothetical protein